MYRLAQLTAVRVTLIGIAACAADTGPAWRRIAEDLQSEVPRVRAVAANRLGELRAKQALPVLIDALSDRSPQVRSEAARALGRIRDPRAVEPLIRALKDPDSTVRFYAAWALGELKDPRAADALLQALRDSEWCVRDQAAWALRELRVSDLVPRLIETFAASADARLVGPLLRELAGTQLDQALQP
ncbi:MAG: HEAT repeat domain-containing protein, partial [Planctomycetes bacterium]|nr:HEAT repeat domain-containing protein [Planctomycetota bacterium]